MGHVSDFYQKVLDDMFDGVYFVDLKRRITYWNRGAERITGFSSDEVVGRRCSENILVHVDDCGLQLCEAGCPLTRVVRGGDVGTLEVFLRHRNGHRVPVLIRAAPMRDEDGKVIGAIEIFSDNSSKVTAVAQVKELERAAFLDPLTGLPNRRFGSSFLAARVEEQRSNGWPYGILMVDIDHFKKVNDTLGHQAGDEVLKTVARSISGGIRAGDLACRWGGEEFLVILTNPEPAQIGHVASRICSLIRSSNIRSAGGSFRVTASLGATISLPGLSAEAVVARADELLYESKAEGRNRVTCDVGERAPESLREAS